jgi:hypothetical protein
MAELGGAATNETPCTGGPLWPPRFPARAVHFHRVSGPRNHPSEWSDVLHYIYRLIER